MNIPVHVSLEWVDQMDKMSSMFPPKSDPVKREDTEFKKYTFRVLGNGTSDPEPSFFDSVVPSSNGKKSFLQGDTTRNASKIALQGPGL